MPFTSRLLAELVDDLANDGQGEWVLHRPLEFVRKNGVRYVVPAGFSTDFASVPRVVFAYLLTGNTAHRPAVLHDWLIRLGICTREEADDIFLEAMESINMPSWRVAMMYQAVCAYTRQIAEKANPNNDPFADIRA